MAEDETEPIVKTNPDPTANVKELVEASIKRLDDVQSLTSMYTEKIADLRDSHLKEIASLRAEYEDRLRRAETERINAIRAVDVGQVQRSAEVASEQAATLAATVVTSAEALRARVEAAAIAAATSLQAALAPLQTRMEELSKAQYEQQGQKAQVVETRQTRGATVQNAGLWIAAIIGVAAIAVTLILALTGRG
jgi:hypothetical protein